MLSVVIYGFQITHEYRDFGEVFLVRINDIRMIFLKSLQFSESVLQLSNHKSLLNPSFLGMDAEMESKLNVLFVVMSSYFLRFISLLLGRRVYCYLQFTDSISVCILLILLQHFIWYLI